MNSHPSLHLLLVLAGLSIVGFICFLGHYVLSEQHPLRKWATAFINHHGLIATARLVGCVLLLIVFATLTLRYS